MTSQAWGSGTHVYVDLPSWPHLKGAPNMAEKVCGWMGIALSTGQLHLEGVLSIISRTSSAPPLREEGTFATCCVAAAAGGVVQVLPLAKIVFERFSFTASHLVL